MIAGTAGIDGQTIAEVETYGVARMLEELRVQVETHRYRPQPVRRVYIAKADGVSQRPLGIPRVRDRALQARGAAGDGAHLRGVIKSSS